jgi:hypothetical protein
LPSSVRAGDCSERQGTMTATCSIDLRFMLTAFFDRTAARSPHGHELRL